MTDIAFTLPAERPQERWPHERSGRSRSITAVLQPALTYAAFCMSIAFSFALVLGVIH